MTQSRKVLGYVALWTLLLSTLAIQGVFAHGDHGDAAPPEGGISLVTLDGFQAELLTSPRPPRAGEESKIVIKILRNGSLAPVSNGKVLIGASPLQLNHNPLNGGTSVGGENHAINDVTLSTAKEEVWAGNYTVVQQFSRQGVHLVRIALLELEERKFDPPAILEFYLNVSRPAGPTPGLLFVLLTAVLTGGGGIYWAVLRSRPRAVKNLPLNLLDIPWVSRFVRWKGFLPALQIPVLALMFLIMLLGFFDIQDGGKNLATKLTWIVWWPGIIFTFILVGRLWCVMCPFGAINEWTAKLAKPQKMFPKALRGLWLATLFFVLLTWADEQLGIIRSPLMTAWLILFLSVAAIGVGVLFQRRSFCRYLCPITGLQGLYSMVSPIELRSQDRSQCGQGCEQNCYRGSEEAAGCPMFEFPMTVDRNTFCNFCFECVKSCPKENLALRLRTFGGDLWSSTRRYLDEGYLALALVGITTIVTAQMLSSWPDWVSALARMIPVSIRTFMKPVTYLTLTESLIFFVGSLIVFPLVGYLAAWMARRILNEEEVGVKRLFIVLAYMFIPIGLAMHLAHNLSHLLMEGQGVFPALQRALNQYTWVSTGEPNWNVPPLVSGDIVYGFQMLLILTGLVFSIVAGYRLGGKFLIHQEKMGKALVPFMVVATLFTLVNLYLLNQPMGMRHGM